MGARRGVISVRPRHGRCKGRRYRRLYRHVRPRPLALSQARPCLLRRAEPARAASAGGQRREVRRALLGRRRRCRTGGVRIALAQRRQRQCGLVLLRATRGSAAARACRPRHALRHAGRPARAARALRPDQARRRGHGARRPAERRGLARRQRVHALARVQRGRSAGVRGARASARLRLCRPLLCLPVPQPGKFPRRPGADLPVRLRSRAAREEELRDATARCPAVRAWLHVEAARLGRGPARGARGHASVGSAGVACAGREPTGRPHRRGTAQDAEPGAPARNGEGRRGGARRQPALGTRGFAGPHRGTAGRNAGGRGARRRTAGGHGGGERTDRGARGENDGRRAGRQRQPRGHEGGERPNSRSSRRRRRPRRRLPTRGWRASRARPGWSRVRRAARPPGSPLSSAGFRAGASPRPPRS